MIETSSARKYTVIKYYNDDSKKVASTKLDEALTWSPNPEKLPFMTNKWHIGEDDIKLGDFSYYKGDKIDAYKCNTCNIIIINANKDL